MTIPWKRIRGKLLVTGAVALLLGLLGIVGAALRITASFETRERDAASRLLGRPYPVLEGARLSIRELARRLDRLGYRRLTAAAGTGTYRVHGGTVEADLRAFRDPAGEHPAASVRVRFDGDRIASVDPPGAALEPETLAVLHGPEVEERELIDLRDCPKHLIDAILAAEDRRFFLHPGIDPAGIARAAWADISSGSLSQGGSTLTQQLAKNLYFSGERTFARKAGEAFAALVLEARYSKERILRAYVNEIYLGQRGAASIRGVARAARHYFDKDAANLTLAESALIAGMIRAPGLYNPFLHRDRARERRDAVLRAMEENGSITERERRAAETQPVRVSPRRTPASRAPYVADLVRIDLESAYGRDLSRLGLRIHTTIDPLHQEAAEAAVAEGLARIERSYRWLRRREQRALQAALIAVDLEGGGIVAMVGGRDFGSSQFNRATSARRQPGSLFKPVVYMAGLTHPGGPGGGAGGGRRRPRDGPSGDDEIVSAPGAAGDLETAEAGWRSARADAHTGEARSHRRRWWRRRDERREEEPLEDGDGETPPAMPLTAATILMDEPYEVLSGGKTWSPRNDDDTFRGPVTVQRALEESLNVPTARAAAAIGLARIVGTARALGITSVLPEVPSLALGTAEVTPAEMATAFTTIASGGRRRRLSLLRGVEDPSGAVGDGAPTDSRRTKAARRGLDPPPAGDRSIPEEAAHVMTALLQGVIENGTGRAAREMGFEGTVAGKTGTSDGGRDLWFCGYTPKVLTLVWVGFDDAAPTHLSGARAALPIWVDFMKRIGAETDAAFEADSDITWAAIDPVTGRLARFSCPEARWAPFIPGTEPSEACAGHRPFWSRWSD